MRRKASSLIAQLKACSSLRNLEQGKALHEGAIRSGDASDVVVANTLISMYVKCGSLLAARDLFEAMQTRTVVSWNALLLGYVDNGKAETALDLLSRMDREGFAPNARTLVAALKACTDLAAGNGRMLCRDRGSASHLFCRERGNALHELARKAGCDSDMFVRCALVGMYAKFGSMEEAQSVFDSMEQPDVATWTALVLGYAENGDCVRALHVFALMLRQGCAPDGRIFVAALKACTAGGRDSCRTSVMALHLLASRSDCDSNMYVKSLLVDAYSKSGNIDHACRIFTTMTNPDVVSWTAVILGCADNGMGELALQSFSTMVRQGCVPNALTYVAALKACIDLALENTLIDMYAKCGSMDDARSVFDRMQHPDVVCWNTLISGYAENDEGETALDLFAEMRRKDYPPDSLTYVAVLKACGKLGALDFGRKVHSQIHSSGLELDNALTNSLVDFYAKCGSLVEAEKVFTSHTTKDLATWNALMTGYCRHGDAAGVFNVFDRMRDKGVRPDDITFKCIFTACSHAGLVHKGKEYFELMSTKYGIKPDPEHYTCIIDILGRANKLLGLPDRQCSVAEVEARRGGLTTFSAPLAVDSKNEL